MVREVKTMFRKLMLLFLLGLLTAAMLLSGCGGKKPSPTAGVSPGIKKPSAKELANKSILMVIAPKDFRDEELFEPKKIFEEKGAKVSLASTVLNEVKGMLGGTAKPQLRISEAKAEDYDAIVIVGGIGSKEYLWGDKELSNLVKQAYREGKLVAAICLSPVVLARAGILKGKQATVFPAPEAVEELKRNGADYVNQKVVVSGKIITARDTKSARDFALAIAEHLVDYLL